MKTAKAIESTHPELLYLLDMQTKTGGRKGHSMVLLGVDELTTMGISGLV